MNSATNIAKKERVIVYIDGFNIYFGILEAGFLNCKWLDINKLVNNLCKQIKNWSKLNILQAE